MAALSATCRASNIDIETIFELTGPRTTVPSGPDTPASVPSTVFSAPAQFIASSTASSTPDTSAYVPTTMSTASSIPLAASLTPTTSLLVVQVSDSKELRSRATGGIAAAVTLAGLCIIGTLAWLCLRKRKSRRRNRAVQKHELLELRNEKDYVHKIPI